MPLGATTGCSFNNGAALTEIDVPMTEILRLAVRSDQAVNRVAEIESSEVYILRRIDT